MIIDIKNYGSGGSGSGSTVYWNQIVTGGTKIATVTIDDVPTNVFAPEGGQGGSGLELVNYDDIDTAKALEIYANPEGYVIERTVVDEYAEHVVYFTFQYNTHFLQGNVKDCAYFHNIGSTHYFITEEEIKINEDGEIEYSLSTVKTNYFIVNSLSDIENPLEGYKAFVKTGSREITLNGWKCDFSNTGYVEQKFYLDGDNKYSFLWTGTQILIGYNGGWFVSGDYTGDWQKHEEMFYKVVEENHTVEIVTPYYDDMTKDSQEGVDYSDTSYTYEDPITPASYMYNGTDWIPTSDIVYNLDYMSQAERGAMITKFIALPDEDIIAMHVYKGGAKLNYERKENNKIWFNVTLTNNPNGYYRHTAVKFALNTQGTYEENTATLPCVTMFKVDMDTYELSGVYGDAYLLFRASRYAEGAYFVTGGYDWQYDRFETTKFVTSNTWVRPMLVDNEWKLDDNHQIFGCEFRYDDKHVKAEWKVENGGITNILWDETTEN